MNPIASTALSRDVKLRIANLSKSFAVQGHTTHAIQDISLDFIADEFTVIVGPSGCGKTTMLRLLAGLDQPTSGQVIYGECRPDKPKCNMVFQQQAIFPWMTVWNNIAFGLRRQGKGGAELSDIVNRYLKVTGLAGFEKFYPYQLSGGMKQRVGVARAFANDPEVLLMDEPFAALDEQNKTILQDELLRLWEQTKKTVIFITHSIDEAISMADRVIVMTNRPGKIKAILPIPFPRPRKIMELRTNAAYGDLVYKVWRLLSDEVVSHEAKQNTPN
ncbi:MAG TPA: ABC transporter ATP-binding protein [Candidatus Binatus sp.]|nr:ABC transporter ATP-binding protein [Candidatus Binatus sp.]